EQRHGPEPVRDGSGWPLAWPGRGLAHRQPAGVHAVELLGGRPRGAVADPDRPGASRRAGGLVCVAELDRARLPGPQERRLAVVQDADERPGACGPLVGGGGVGHLVGLGGGGGGARAGDPGDAAACRGGGARSDQLVPVGPGVAGGAVGAGRGAAVAPPAAAGMAPQRQGLPTASTTERTRPTYTDTLVRGCR